MIFMGLCYLSFVLYDILIFSKIKHIVLPNYDYKLFHSIGFGVIVALSLVNNKNITPRRLLILFLIEIIGFVLTGILILNSLKTQISPDIAPTFQISFQNLLYIPIYPFLIISSIRLVKIPFINSFIKNIPNFKTSFDLPQTRLFAYWIDVILAWIIIIISNSLGPIFIFIEILLFLFAYRVTMETVFSATIGKMLFGLTIIRNDLKDLEIRDIILRNISRIIPFYWIPILYNSPALHDRISKTTITKKVMVESMISN